MRNYRMVMAGRTMMLAWQYDFTMASDSMACEYVEKTMVTDPAARKCLRIDLFDMTEDDQGHGQHVAGFTAITPPVAAAVRTSMAR